jgi:polysaccharide export outer membrane protein
MMRRIGNAGFRALLKKTNGSVWLKGFDKAQQPLNQRSRSKTAIGLMIMAFAMHTAAAAAPKLLQAQQNPPAQTEAAANQGSKAATPDAKAAPRNGASIQLHSDKEYRLAANDLVEIKVEKAEELSGTYRVTAAGSFLMKFLGRVAAQGKTSEQLATQIADGLRGRYLVDPDVRVTVVQHSGQAYFIQGAVRSPGMFQIQGRLTLLELISIAGGLADNHGSTAYLIRKVKPQAAAVQVAGTSESPEADDTSEEAAKFELVKANIAGLLRGTLNNNINVEAGDMITIPPTDVFFVSGAVEAPGSFPLKDGTTLRQAISLAQGPNSKASLSKSVIYREDPATGKQTEIKVDISAVMSGKKEDLIIQPNDIIQIPDSRLKSIRNTVLTTFGFTATRIVRF